MGLIKASGNVATKTVDWDPSTTLSHYVKLLPVNDNAQNMELFCYPARTLLHLSCENSGVSERQFNNDLLSIQRAHVTFDRLQRSEGEIRPHGFQIRLDSDLSLFHDRLTPPSQDQLSMGNKCLPNGTFGCTETQLQVVKIVREAARIAAQAQGKAPQGR